MAQYNNAKKAFETILATRKVPDEKLTDVLGPNASKDAIVASVDPVAGAAKSFGKVPVTITREADTHFQSLLADVEKTIDAGAAGGEDVASIAAFKALSESVMSEEGLRSVALFEEAFTPADMEAKYRSMILKGLQKGNKKVIDDITFETDEVGNLTGKVTLGISGKQPVQGKLVTGSSGNMYYIPENSPAVRVNLGEAELRYDDIAGDFEIEGGKFRDAPYIHGALSPRASTISAQELDSVKAGIRLDGSSQEIANQYTALLEIALSPIAVPGKFSNPLKKKRSLEKLQQVLLEGDEFVKEGVEVGREFTTHDLIAKGLNKQERAAYFNVRQLAKQMWSVKNAEARKIAVRKGYKNINIPKVTANEVTFEGRAHNMGKVLRDPSELAKQVGGVVYDVSLQREVRTSDIVANWKGEYVFADYRLVKLHSGSQRGLNPAHKGKGYKYIIVKDPMIEELPPEVLKFKEGWMPRTYERARYFVREFDKQGNFIKTHRYFDNAKEARLYEEDLAAGKYNGNPEHSFKAQSEGEFLKQSEEEDLFEGVGGLTDGLYTSARAANKLPFGHPDLELQRDIGRTNIMDDLRRQLGSAALHQPRNEWRIGEEQRMRNTIKKYLGSDVAMNWKGLRDPVPLVGSHDLARAIELRRQKIEKMAGIQSQDEKMWQRLSAGIYEWAVKPGSGKTKQAFSELAWFAHENDPFAFMRTVAFHSLLGMGRLDQLWVQAQGAANAAAMNVFRPDKILKFLPQQATLNTIVNMDDAQLAVFAKKALFAGSYDDLRAKRDLYRKSGLLAGIDTNADWKASEQGYAIGATGMRKVLDAGLIPYRAGERFNRGFSFLTALDEFQTGAKLYRGRSLKGVPLSKYDDDILRGVTSRANDLMLNLGKANAAKWQEGVLSVPTQFLQVQAKLFEDISGAAEGLTGGERFKMLLGQFLLYGAAGVPAGKYLAGLALEGKFETPEERDAWIAENPSAVAAMTDGIWGFLFMAAFGADISTGRRGSVLSSVEEVFMRLVTEDDFNAMEVLLGPGGVAAKESWRAAKNLKMLAFSTIKGVEPSDVALEKAVRHLSRIAASTRAAENAYLMHKYGIIPNSKGKVIAREDFALGTELFTGAGFQPAVKARTWSLKEAVIAEKEEQTAIIDEMVARTVDMISVSSVNEWGEISDEELVAHQEYLAALLQTAYGDNDGMKQELLDKLYERITDPKTDREKVVEEYFRLGARDLFNGLLDRLDANRVVAETKEYTPTATIE
jgi:hypothetical protein